MDPAVRGTVWSTMVSPPLPSDTVRVIRYGAIPGKVVLTSSPVAAGGLPPVNCHSYVSGSPSGAEAEKVNMVW
jgi:hypothetical protein